MEEPPTKRRKKSQVKYSEDAGMDEALLKELKPIRGYAREEPLIERILARRRIPVKAAGEPAVPESSGEGGGDPDRSRTRSQEPRPEVEEKEGALDDYEYLVKWRGKSYLHVDWIQTSLIAQDVDGTRRLKTFVKSLQKKKLANRNNFDMDSESFFDPSFVEVERIVDSTHPEAEPQQEEDQTNTSSDVKTQDAPNNQPTSKDESQQEQQNGVATKVEPQANGDAVVQPTGSQDASGEKSLSQVVTSTLSSGSSRRWVREAQQVLAQLLAYRYNRNLLSVFFMEKVDEVLDGAPGYYEKISEPMYFNLIQKRLLNDYYASADDFARDVRLVFENCRKYNEDTSLYVRFCGDQLSKVFEAKYAKMLGGGDVSLADDRLEEERMFLVKWRGLSYAELTWEKESDILDDTAIAAFYRRSRMPTETTTTSPAALQGGERQFIKYTTSPVFKNGLELRSYQLEGLNWLAFNHANHRGSILADEMGLGKTCQTVSFVNHLHQQGYLHNRPALIVAPLSTLGHWRNEFERWSDLNVVVYHDQGNRLKSGAETRKLIRDYEFYFWKVNPKTGTKKIIPGLLKFQVLITSFEALRDDAHSLSNIRFSALVVDEGHRLKSRKAKLATTFRSLINADTRVILTGTPLQNDVEELFNLLNFIEPKEFGDKESFLRQFGDLQKAEQVQQLQNRVKPYMLRRLKEHVEKDIPAKEETVIDVELTILQKKYYRAIFERNREFLARGSTSSSSSSLLSPQLTNIEMELRKCCNHPYLITGVEQKEAGGPPGSSQAFKSMIQASGKMVLLDKLLAKLWNEKRKVLIFSQFKIMLDIIEDYCHHPERKYPVERIDGNTSSNARQKAIDRYGDPRGRSFIFLLSTRAGGVGINLTAADTVIIFDSDWNPQNDLQAMARCHRIGQKNSVSVYRFVTKNTYESHLFDRAARKLGLEQAVLGRQGSASGSTLMASDASGTGKGAQSKEEIEELLRFGAYRLLENDDEAAEKSRQYSEANIDDLLARASRKVNWDKDTGDGSGGAGGGGGAFSFSKASFVAAGTDEEIDVADPKFWTKVLGEDPRSTLLSRLLDGSAYATEETKRAYFDELRAAGMQVIQEKLNGNVKPDFEEQVIQCLSQIVNMKRTFSEREQAAAAQFMRQVERPSRRQQTEVYRFHEDERIPDELNPTPRESRMYDNSSVFGDDDSESGRGRSRKFSRKRRTVEINGRTLDMCHVQSTWIEPDALKQAVEDAGGYETVVRDRNWTAVREKLGLIASNSVNFSIHRVFKKYFLTDAAAVPSVAMEGVSPNEGSAPSSVTGTGAGDAATTGSNEDAMDGDYVEESSHAEDESKVVSQDLERKQKQLKAMQLQLESLEERQREQELKDAASTNGKQHGKDSSSSSPSLSHSSGNENDESDESSSRVKESEKKKKDKSKAKKKAKKSKETGKRKRSSSSVGGSKTRIKLAPKIEWEIKRLDPEIYVTKTKNKEPWCKYCGAVESSGFTRGPWGPKTLCVAHYVEWFQKKTLDLRAYEANEPEQPINPDANSQFKYLAFKKQREEQYKQFEESAMADKNAVDEHQSDEGEQDEDLGHEMYEDENGNLRRRSRSRRSKSRKPRARGMYVTHVSEASSDSAGEP